ncbi:MAG: DNA polymerase Y family protein [Pirellulaceae bacterium]|jgi:protein ImuB|nr:DNA polymerase Y family protein [Pirellulaceae bacterium]
MKRFLCLRLPGWPIQRLVVAQPALKGCAIILHDRVPRRGQLVVACSQVAYRAGVRPGMPLAEAVACDERAAIFAADRPADTAALRALAQWCERFSPLVGLGAPDTPSDLGAKHVPGGPDHLLLDATGVAAHFGGEAALARQVAEAFEQRGYCVRVALASTLSAAWAVARYAAHTVPAVESSAVVALPAGSTYRVVPAAAMWETLQTLPVRALRLPASTQALLDELGLVQLGQLAVVPRAAWSARFGDLLIQRWDQLTGRSHELLVPHQPPPVFRACQTLEYPTSQHQLLTAVLLQLVQDLSRQLVARQVGVLELICRFHCAPVSDRSDRAPAAQKGSSESDSVAMRLGLFQPTTAVDHLTQLVQLQLAQLVLPGPVEQLAVEAARTAPLTSRPQALFADSASRAARQLGPLVDRLACRLGPAAVVQPQLEVDAQPERAYRYQPLTVPGRAAASTHRAARHAPRQPHLVRPLHLRDPPVPLDVLAVLPDGPPIGFHLQHRAHRVARYWGPERLETGWWRGRSVRRDYYRLETDGGLWFWIFRELDEGQWFLQGLFG